MVANYKLDTEDEKIINELENLCGVVQNKQVLRDIILYLKLKQNNKLDFGNCNIIVRNNSSYDLLTDLLNICSKIFIKYNVIQNNRICYLDKIINSRRDFTLDKFLTIEEDIVVINEDKSKIRYVDEMSNLKRIMNQYKNKIFIFEDKNWREGEIDAQIGDLAPFRMTINQISLEDKILYCKNRFEEQNLRYKEIDLKSFSDVPFWILRNMVTQLIIECKSKEINFIDKNMLQMNKSTANKRTGKRETKKMKIKDEKTAKEEMNELIGLKETKKQMEKILNYIKLNKERGKMPTLHMCFTGNPGTGKTSIARIIGKMFEEEKILSGSGEFVEIHGRDLVDLYVGWTAQKVHDTVEKAIGGVLFIDEAYSLVTDRRGSYEDEAIATLIKEMEDHRDEICIILAGYTNEMKKLLELNPGFESRIQFKIEFPNYTPNELWEIFSGLCKKEKYKITNSCKELLLDNFEKASNQEHFGNGRYVRNVFEKLKFEQADRVVKDPKADKDTIIKQDVENVLRELKLSENTKTKRIGF